MGMLGVCCAARKFKSLEIKMSIQHRRHFLLTSSLLPLSSALVSSCASSPSAPAPPSALQRLSLVTGAPGGGFLLYGEALSATLAASSHLDVQVLPTQGTAENINRLHARDIDVALLVMGPAWDAWNGQASWKDKPQRMMRALAPMYETPFHCMARTTSGISNLQGLAGKRVGVGPAKGTAEGFFTGLMEALKINCTLVNGTPTQHAEQLAKGEIDVFWFGAGLPVPAFVQAVQLGGAASSMRVFGFTAAERAAFLQRFPYFAAFTIPANTYAGQTQPVESVAVWNFVAVHAAMSDDLAYWITRSILQSTAELTKRYPAAASTRGEFLAANTFLPFHPGAQRYFREQRLPFPER
jgi:uncharacterized protein